MTDGQRAAAWALRLALPQATADARVDDATWAATLAIARRERLTALAWERNADVIRRAPSSVATAWRGDAIAAVGRAERQLAVLGDVLRLCRETLGARADGVMVLRGLPLAQRLYGAAAVRWTGDTDLYVPAADRARLHDALITAGWFRHYGTVQTEAAFSLDRGGARATLELHSSLADDQLVVHLAPPAPRAAITMIDGEPVPSHADEFLPAYLALHLAKHGTSPLLWDVDLLTLWSGLDEHAREAAYAAAGASRTLGYLRWALGRAERVPAAADGDAHALRALGVGDDGRPATRHNARHLLVHAGSLVDALRIALQWAWPNEQGRGWEMLRSRARRVFGERMTTGTAGAALSSGAELVDRRGALEVTGAGLAETVRAIVGAGGTMWLKARGGSMSPAIPHESLVRLAPVAPEGVRRGDVVLALVGGGRPVVHRVVGRRGSRVLLQGDTMARSDGFAAVDDVLAVADAVSLDGRVVPMRARPGPSWWRTLRRLPRQGLELARRSVADVAQARPSR